MSGPVRSCVLSVVEIWSAHLHVSARAKSILLPTTAPAPRSIALFAAVRAQPPAGSLPPMPTGHRGEPFLSVTTRAHKTIYDNRFPGVYAICPRTVAGAAGEALRGRHGRRAQACPRPHRPPAPEGHPLVRTRPALLSWAERGAPPSGRRFVVRQRARTRVVDGLLGQVTGVLYRGGVIKLPRARARVRRRENFGDVDCKSVHLCPEIDATHTLLTTTNEYAVPTTNYDDTLATMTKATVSLPSLPALLTAWPGSIWSSSLK